MGRRKDKNTEFTDDSYLLNYSHDHTEDINESISVPKKSVEEMSVDIYSKIMRYCDEEKIFLSEYLEYTDIEKFLLHHLKD